MKMSSKIIVAVVSALLTLSAVAQPGGGGARTPEQAARGATEVRQALFMLISNNNNPLGAMARGRAPMDLALAEKQATRVAQLAAMITDAFVQDTRAFDIETEALDVIWEKPEDFASKAQATVDAANAIAMAAASGDEDATKKALAGIGRTCGGCHDDFREE